MGLVRAGLGLAVALWLYGLGSLVCAVQDYWDDPSHLHCGSDALEFSLPSLLQDAVFALTVIDKNGRPHYLHNDSACGTWLGQTSDGSVVVGSAFDGCYVRKENGNHMVTITLEEVLRDGKSQYHKKDLACPVLLAMDAPSPSDCALVGQEERLQCANDSVSRELCEGLGCCFSQYDRILRCYYGKKLTALCTTDSNMVVAISKDLTKPSLILDSVRVVDVDANSCPSLRVVRTASFIGYQFPLSCGSTSQVADMSVVYENTFVATNGVTTWRTGSITRDSTMRVTVRCSYSHTHIVPLQVEVVTLPPPLPVSTSGPLLVEMRIAEGLQYNSYYTDQDYPIERVLRDPVHVEVRVLQRTDPSLVLVLNNCWATNSPVPTAAPQWPILINSCPYDGDNYLTQLVPVGPSSQGLPFPTHYKRFIVSTFTFVESSTQAALNGLVFFHCSASICVPSAMGSCSENCVQRQKRIAEPWASEDAPITVRSHGPVIFYSEANERAKVDHEPEAKDAPSPSDCASVRQEERLQCANDSVSRELCEGLGCCFSQYDRILRCYYGKKLTALCTADSNMVVAFSKDLTKPSLILDSVRVVDVDANSCPSLRVVRTASFIGYQFPLSCGSTNQVADMSVVYENTFVATNLVTTWRTGSITRDSTMRVTVRCSYSHTDIVPLQVEVVTLPPPLPVSTSGPLLLEMRIAEDLQYNSYYTDRDYPIERVLRDPVHVEVRVLQRTDPSLVLVLNNCWATNSPVPTAAPQWPILTNSCPYDGDNYLTQLVPVGPSSQGLPFPTHYKRFIVSTFTFVDSSTQTALNGLVFLHCSASICVPSAMESCSVNCAQRQKRTAEFWTPEDALTTVTSHGPVIFHSEQNKTDKVVHEPEGHLGSGLVLASLQGAAAAGLILMVCLLGIYLYLYLYKRQNRCAVSIVNA